MTGGRYAGLALTAEAHAPEIEAKKGLLDILHCRDVVLHPAMNIQEAIAVFDAAEAESLAVVEAGDERRPIGILDRGARHAPLRGGIRTAASGGYRRRLIDGKA